MPSCGGWTEERHSKNTMVFGALRVRKQRRGKEEERRDDRENTCAVQCFSFLSTPQSNQYTQRHQKRQISHEPSPKPPIPDPRHPPLQPNQKQTPTTTAKFRWWDVIPLGASAASRAGLGWAGRSEAFSGRQGCGAWVAWPRSPSWRWGLSVGRRRWGWGVSVEAARGEEGGAGDGVWKQAN